MPKKQEKVQVAEGYVAVEESEFERLMKKDLRPERTFLDLEKHQKDALWEFAQRAVKGGFGGHHTLAESAYCAICYGLEVGFTPNQSLQNIYTVPGPGGKRTAALLVEAKAALIVSKGFRPPKKWVEGEELKGTPKERDIRAICETYRDGVTYRGSFTYGEALDANLARKDNWVPYWRDMLKWRAEDRAIDDAFPDIIRGLAGAENLDPWEEEKTTKLSIDRLREKMTKDLSSDGTVPWAEGSKSQEADPQSTSTRTEEAPAPSKSATESDTPGETDSPSPASDVTEPSPSSQTSPGNKGWLPGESSSSSPPVSSTPQSRSSSRRPSESSTPTSSTKPSEQTRASGSSGKSLSTKEQHEQRLKENEELWLRWQNLKLPGGQVLTIKKELGVAFITQGMERGLLEKAFSLGLKSKERKKTNSGKT